jgi:hypothetical protein
MASDGERARLRLIIAYASKTAELKSGVSS